MFSGKNPLNMRAALKVSLKDILTRLGGAKRDIFSTAFLVVGRKTLLREAGGVVLASDRLLQIADFLGCSNLPFISALGSRSPRGKGLAGGPHLAHGRSG